MKWIALAFALLATQAQAQTTTFSNYLKSLPGASTPFVGTEQLYVLQGGLPRQAPVSAFAALSGPVTSGNLIAGGPGAVQMQDTAALASSPGYAILPVGINITKTIAFGGTAAGAANSIIWAKNLTASGVCALSPGSACVISQQGIINNVDSSANSNGMWAFEWDQTVQSSAKGAGVTGMFTLSYTGSADTNGQYAALETFAQANANAGGTAGAGNGKGDLFGFSNYCRLLSGATNWKQCVGTETDISVRTGVTPASVDQIIGQQIVIDAQSVIGANQIAIAYSANNQAVAASLSGWDILFADGAYAGYPSLKVTGTIFKCYAHANTGDCGTISAGFDLTGYGAITNNAFASPGYSVTGTGTVTGLAFVPTSSTIPTDGLYEPSSHVTGIASNSAIDAFFGITGTVPWISVGVSGQVNAGDFFAIRASQSGIAGETIKNVDAGTTSKASLYFANSASNTQAQIALNSSGFSGGQGANALTISNTNTAPIVIGTGTEVIKLGSSGAFTANGSVATVLGSVGAVGAHTAVQKWLTITDNGGAVGYIPVF